VDKGNDHLQLIKFWPSHIPRKGVCSGAKNLAPPYYSQCAVSVSPLSTFFIGFVKGIRVKFSGSFCQPVMCKNSTSLSCFNAKIYQMSRIIYDTLQQTMLLLQVVLLLLIVSTT